MILFNFFRLYFNHCLSLSLSWIQDRENLHFLYYLDYLRVFAYNFHVKDFKDKVLDKTEKTDVDGKSGGGGWKKDKRVRTEDGEAPAAVTASEVPTNDPQTEV